MNTPSHSRNTDTASGLLILAVLIGPLLILLFGGCSLLPKGVDGGSAPLAPIVQRTNIVENLITTPATTNTVATPSGEIVAVITPSVTVTNWQTNIVSEVNPLWQQTITGARAVNSTLNPTPTAPFVNIGLSILSGGLAWFAAFQNKRRARESGLVNTLIAGVEASKNPEVKQAIKETSVLFGKDRELTERVRVVTTSGPNP